MPASSMVARPRWPGSARSIGSRSREASSVPPVEPQAAPLVAILRGLTPERAPSVGALLVETGFRIMEVPLNSPEPFQTIKLLSEAHGAQCLVGAGTVLGVAEVDRVHGAGGRLVVAPNCEPAVIRRALELGM